MRYANRRTQWIVGSAYRIAVGMADGRRVDWHVRRRVGEIADVRAVRRAGGQAAGGPGSMIEC